MKTLISAYSVEGKSYLVKSDVLDFDVDGLTVFTEDAEVFINGKKCEDFGVSFHMHGFSADEAAQSVILAYINDNLEFSFSDVDSRIETYKKKHFEDSGYSSVDGRKISRHYISQNEVLDLILINKDGFSYYECLDGSEDVALVRPNGTLATYMPEFYGNALVDDVAAKDYQYVKSNEYIDNLPIADDEDVPF